MRKPIIAITARQYYTSDNPYFHENSSYFDFIEKCGGIGAMITYHISEQDADDIAASFDGLLLTGGPDCDPSLYHEENNGSLNPNLNNDLFDIKMYRAFKKAGKPVLGICRGMQVIAIAEGASLIQDIPTEFGTYHNQASFEKPLGLTATAHEAKFVPGTYLHSLFSDIHPINSYHHQAVREVPQNFKIAAKSQEGIIEAMEAKDTDNIICVQWHPERLLWDEKECMLGRHLIEQALSTRQSE